MFLRHCDRPPLVLTNPKSQLVLETARKDLSSVVTQAQKELGILGGEASESSSSHDAPTVDTVHDEVPENKGHTPEATTEPVSDAKEEGPSSPPPSAQSSTFQTFLSRVQSTLPPNISTTLQNNLPESLRDGHGIGVDFSQLATTLTSEFQRVQGVTRAQAEEYAHRSESLIREAGAFLKDAVKVIPPEYADGEGGSGLAWDGSEVWAMPPSVGSMGPGQRNLSVRWKGKGKEREALMQARAASTRAEMLLRRLKRDPELLKPDPAAEESSKELYTLWLDAEVRSTESGIDGSFWSKKISDSLEDGEEGITLKETFDSLGRSQFMLLLRSSYSPRVIQCHRHWKQTPFGLDISSKSTRLKRTRRRERSFLQVCFRVNFYLFIS